MIFGNIILHQTLGFKKHHYGGAARNAAVGFSIGNFGYLGTGSGTAGSLNDFWQYNPATDIMGAKI